MQFLAVYNNINILILINVYIAACAYARTNKLYSYTDPDSNMSIIFMYLFTPIRSHVVKGVRMQILRQNNKQAAAAEWQHETASETVIKHRGTPK